MIINSLDTIYAIVWPPALARIAGAVFGNTASGGIVRVSEIPIRFLAPCLFMALAAFQSGQTDMDVAVLCTIGLPGIQMCGMNGWRSAFPVGLLQPTAAETVADHAARIARPRFPDGFEVGMGCIFSPKAMALRALTLVSVTLEMRQARHILTEDAVSSTAGRGPADCLPQFSWFLECVSWNGTVVRGGGTIAALRPLAAMPDRDFRPGPARVIVRLPCART